MGQWKFMPVWHAIVGSAAMISLILTAFGLMLGIVKPAEFLKRIGTLLGIVILLWVIPGVIASAWSSLPLWQRCGVVAIGISVFLVCLGWRQLKHRHNR